MCNVLHPGLGSRPGKVKGNSSNVKTETIGKSKAYSKTVSTSLYTARSHLFWAGMFCFLSVFSLASLVSFLCR